MGELARGSKQPRRLYRGLRPEAYALSAYLVRLTREAGGGRFPLIVTSTVRDQEYQRVLIGRNREATQNYSLHTTGYSFDVLRRYSGKRQAMAFQYALDRLTALNLIAWVREPAAIHITVSDEPAWSLAGDEHSASAVRLPGRADADAELIAQVIIPPNWPPVMFSTWPCT